MTAPQAVRAILIVGAALMSWIAPAAATAFCSVEGEGGYAPLRERPSDAAALVVRMREDDEVQLLEGGAGEWVEVLHWHGQDRLDEIRRADVRRGWVRVKLLGPCG